MKSGSINKCKTFQFLYDLVTQFDYEECVTVIRDSGQKMKYLSIDEFNWVDHEIKIQILKVIPFLYALNYNF